MHASCRGAQCRGDLGEVVGHGGGLDLGEGLGLAGLVGVSDDGDPGQMPTGPTDLAAGLGVWVVGLGGLEPPTSSLSGCRSHLLELGTGSSAGAWMSREYSGLSVMVGCFWHGSGTLMSHAG